MADDRGDHLSRPPQSEVAVVTVWRELGSDTIRARLLVEAEPIDPPVVEYAVGVDAIGELVGRWLARFAGNSGQP